MNQDRNRTEHNIAAALYNIVGIAENPHDEEVRQQLEDMYRSRQITLNSPDVRGRVRLSLGPAIRIVLLGQLLSSASAGPVVIHLNEASLAPCTVFMAMTVHEDVVDLSEDNPTPQRQVPPIPSNAPLLSLSFWGCSDLGKVS